MKEPTPEIALLSRFELYFSIRKTTRALRRLADRLDRDYDMVMIFLIIAEAGFQAVFHLAAVEANRGNFEKIYLEVASEGTSLLQIGELSGIPRETVRRKVNKMIENHMLEVNKNNKNIYLPFSTIVRPEIAEIFRSHAADIDQFVRAVQFYSSRRLEGPDAA